MATLFSWLSYEHFLNLSLSMPSRLCCAMIEGFLNDCCVLWCKTECVDASIGQIRGRKKIGCAVCLFLFDLSALFIPMNYESRTVSKMDCAQIVKAVFSGEFLFRPFSFPNFCTESRQKAGLPASLDPGGLQEVLSSVIHSIGGGIGGCSVCSAFRTSGNRVSG